MNPAFSSLTAVAVVFGLAGCASVSVQKVDPTTGKIVEAAAEGQRYYLPRPYVSVFEPFIIDSDVYLARGEMSPDSNYVLLTEVPTALMDLANAKLISGEQKMGTLRIDASKVQVAAPITGTPQAAPAATNTTNSPGAAAPGSNAPDGPAGGSTPKKPEVSSGLFSYKMANDNSAYAVTPQPRYFNILWLPDFDEQYVVSARGGLGNASVVLGMGQGWSLQTIDATVDNSALTKPLLDFWSGTIGALQKVATARIEAPLAMLAGSPQGAPAVDSRTFAGGTPVTVKVTKVRIVAPGLYPILKPKEMESVSLGDEDRKRLLVPRPPLTNIAFNTYNVIVIEAARTTGDSALRIQQYVDSTSPSSATANPPSGDGKPGGKNVDSLSLAQSRLNTELSKPENSTMGQEYFVAKITQTSGVVAVTLQKRSNGTAGRLEVLPDDATLKTKVIDFLKTQGVSATAEGVEIKR